MSDPTDDLLSKADALLSRWRHWAPAENHSADYPVLTEIIGPPPPDQLLSAPVSPPAPDPAIIEARLQQQVWEAIEPELARIIAARVRTQLDAAARYLAEELAVQVSNDVAELIGNAMRHALEGELTELLEGSARGKR